MKEPLILNPQAWFKSFDAERKIRARVLPKQLKPAHIFAPETLFWLEACAISTLRAHGAAQGTCYMIPLLGVTDRPLARYKKAGLNLFSTLVKINTKAKLTNLDQCTIEFGPRLPISAKAFIDEICRQIYSTSARIKTKGRLTFYCHNSCSTAIATDLETLRLSITKSIPTINIDWLEPSLSWETFWNPCSSLEPIKSKLENKLSEFLDLLIQRVCASQCNLLIRRPGCFFDSVYLPRRQKQQLPDLNRIVFLPDSETNNQRVLDLFKTEKELFKYVGPKSNNKMAKTNSFSQKADGDLEWIPAII